MVQVLRPAQAGTLESGDIFIQIAPAAAGSGLAIELESLVLAQYGQAIRATLAAVAAAQGVQDLVVRAVDRGALDWTIQARMLTALSRAGVALKGGTP